VSAASWYTNAYRANIVTYSIAKLVPLIEERFPGGTLDLDQIWKNQGLPEPLTAQIEATAKASQDVLLSPPQEGANVTEWAKRKDCWERVAAKTVTVNPELLRSLRERGEERDERRRARGDNREEATINGTLKVLKRGEQGFWKRAIEWRNVRRLLTPIEFGILETAVKRGAAWAPSDAQAKRLLDAARKLEDDGLT
jgi:hypothetical protein